jgi:hypothetical protein
MKAMAPILFACCMSGAAGIARRGSSSVAGFVRPLLPVQHSRAASAAAAAAAGPVRMMAAVAEGTKGALDTRVHTGHPKNNVPVILSDKIGRDLHRTPSHPLGIIKDRSVRAAGVYACV